MQPRSEEDRRAFERMLRPENAELIREAYQRCRARGEAARQEVRQESYRLATSLAKAESELKESQERLAEALMKLEEVQNHGRGNAAEGAGGSQAGPTALGKEPASAPAVGAAAAPQENAPRVKQENGAHPSKRARV